MKDPRRAFIFLLIIFCSSSNTVEYEIEISESFINSDVIKNVDSKLVYTIQESSDEVTLQVQSFPKNPEGIESYSLVFLSLIHI